MYVKAPAPLWPPELGAPIRQRATDGEPGHHVGLRAFLYVASLVWKGVLM